MGCPFVFVFRYFKMNSTCIVLCRHSRRFFSVIAFVSLFYFQAIPETIAFQSFQPESPLFKSHQAYQAQKETTPYGLEWEQIGPVINSALVESVQADPQKPGTMYAAFGSGSLWKTTNNGIAWNPIFEDQESYGIGCVELAPSNSDIIYLGTGETLKKPRNFTMPGTGVYRSDDAGENWRYLGLPDSYHIGEIVIHPTNPEIVYVAVLGHFWTTNKNRGVYRSLDGGKSWEHVLFVDEQTGANAIEISESNPNILYASTWQSFPGVNGKSGGIYKSMDAGKSWSKMDQGLPTDEGKGRIGLALSKTNPDKVYALLDHRGQPDSAGAAELYKSVDGGKNWQRTHKEELMIFSVIGWYFTDVYVNPKNDEEVYALGVRLAHSLDGGKTFDLIGGDVFHLFPSPAEPLHLDQCELWINPLNPDHLVLGNDGGLYVSYDKGKSWLHMNNIPTGEFYDITLDNKTPYNIYAGAQDNATVYGPAKEWNPKFYDGWKYLWIDPWSGGDGCITVIDPLDSATLYYSAQEGDVRRMDLNSNAVKYIQPDIPQLSGKVRYNFISPYFMSPHDHKTLYLGGNYLFKSTDRGDNWSVISPDLSEGKDSKKKSLAAGAFVESGLEKGLLYMGTDKGLLWVSRDGGLNWTERSAGLPAAYLRSIVPSKFSTSRVYVALSGLNYDDFNTYLFKSEDYGKTWESIAGNLKGEVSYVLKEDPNLEQVLYAGLYRAVYISTDRGKSWSLLGRNMPQAAVSDIEIDMKSSDLVAATHGRGIYKLNLRPVYEKLARKEAGDHLFEIPPAKLPTYRKDGGAVEYSSLTKLPINFWSVQSGEVRLEVINSANEIIYSTPFTARRGFNTYRWDMVVSRQKSLLPYFVHYERFLKAGNYKVRMHTSTGIREQEFTAGN